MKPSAMALCPVCYRLVVLTRKGVLDKHGPGNRCPGKGTRPI